MWRPALIAASALATLFAFHSPARAEVKYAIKDLGTLGGKNSFAGGLNNAGDVVGQSELADGSRHAFLYRNGVMTDLNVPFGKTSTARDINARGQIAGNWIDESGRPRVYVYNGPGSFNDYIGRVSGPNYALGINDLGDVVGAGPEIPPFGYRSFIYSSTTGESSGGSSQYPTSINGINNKRQFVGTHYRRDFSIPAPGRAFVEYGFVADLDGNPLQDLGTNVYPMAINDAGEIAYQNKGELAINNAGVKVGGLGASAAVFENGQAYDLNTLIAPGSGVFLSVAGDINDLGWIVANGTLGAESHAFLLTPLFPEPATLPLVLLGVMASLCRRRTA